MRQRPRRPAATAKSWPLFRGDALAPGVAKSTLPDKLEVLWTLKVATAERSKARRPSPTASCYLADLDGKLYALNLADRQGNLDAQDRRRLHRLAGGPRRAALRRRHRRQVLLPSTPRPASRSGAYEADAEIDSGANF